MVCTPKVTMTMRELDRLKCVQGVVDRQLKLYQAAERLGLTTRQVRRLVRRYRQEGPVQPYGCFNNIRHITFIRLGIEIPHFLPAERFVPA